MFARLHLANLKGSRHGHLPERGLSVHLSGCRSFLEDGRFGGGVDVAFVDLANVLDDANEPMRVVACQVGIRQMLGDDLCVALAGANGQEQVVSNLG